MKRQLNVLLIVLVATTFFQLNKVQAQNAASKVYSVDEIIENAPALVGQTVAVKGTALHICEQTGRKLFLEAADGKKTFRFNAGSKIDKFNEDALGNEVIATGVVAERRLTLEDLNKQEAAAIAAEKAKKAAGHCTSDAKANDENTAATPRQRVQALKDKLNKQIAAGKNSYLSFYTINDTNEYSIVKTK